MLNRFVKQVRSLSDTPSIIQLIAADAEYLMLCREIVNDSNQVKQETIKPIKAVCHKQGLDFQILQDKLIPAARALGLTSSSNAQLDYYKILGVSPKADLAEIKRAFREKAYRFHPDTSAQEHGDNEKFVKLKTVYETLRDPVLRGHYNMSRRNLNRWHETPIQITSTHRLGKGLFILQLMALIIFLVLSIFIFDFFVP